MTLEIICNEQLFLFQRNESSWKLTIPAYAASRVIGKGGSNVNAVREATGAIIEINKIQESNKQAERTVLAKGTPEMVRYAMNIINYMIYDADVLVTDAIRTVLRGNLSVASSFSSEGTSKSAVDSTYAPSSIPKSLSSASIARQSASPIPQQSSQRSAKSHHHQKDSGGGNVWHQRMAAREEKVEPLMETKRISQSPKQAPQIPSTQQQSKLQSRQDQASETLVRVAPAENFVAPVPASSIAAPSRPNRTFSFSLSLNNFVYFQKMFLIVLLLHHSGESQPQLL